MRMVSTRVAGAELAALALKPGLVGALLDAGASPHTRTTSGKTAADCTATFRDSNDACAVAAEACMALLSAAAAAEPAPPGYSPLPTGPGSADGGPMFCVETSVVGEGVRRPLQCIPLRCVVALTEISVRNV
jgi:hypothetical protein